MYYKVRQKVKTMNTFYKVWRKILPILYIFILIHFLKDITQDMLKISTPLDLLGDVHEDLSRASMIIESLFMVLGNLSYCAELFLLLTIPKIMKTGENAILEKVVVIVFATLLMYFIATVLLDPRFFLRI